MTMLWGQPIGRVFKVALLGLLLLSSSCSRERESGINPGDFAPDFTAQTLEGDSRRFSEFKGKVILLNFWASWCGPCIAEMPALQRLHDKLKDRGFSVVAVGVDDEIAALDEFRRKFGLSFPILVDNAGVTKRLYKNTGVPESFVIDAAGKIQLFLDPDDNSPVTRMSGPREWDSPNVVSRITSLLTAAKR